MQNAHHMGDLGVGGGSRQPGSTALRMLVGAQLRRLRESCGISRQAAAYAIRGSHSKISRLEGGRTGFKARDVSDLLLMYGVDEDERAALLMLAQQANAPGWWQDFRDVVPDWFEAYLGMEQDAALIRTYEVQLVPGLLRTEEYARALIARGHEGASAEEVERRIAVLARRRRFLSCARPRKLWVVMDEAALRRQIGSAATMRGQLEHLMRMAEQPHVTIQVLPFDSDGPVGGVGPVTILRFTEAELDDVVYLEQIDSAQYFSKESDVLPYRHLMDRLGLHARPAAATPAILAQLTDAL
jgi:transcriptional regulator with XRE-family HTH domain